MSGLVQTDKYSELPTSSLYGQFAIPVSLYKTGHQLSRGSFGQIHGTAQHGALDCS